MKINKNYVLREIAGDYLVVPIKEAADELCGIIKLNDTGAFLWNEMLNECTEKYLCQQMMKCYEIDEIAAMEDIKIFVDTLNELGCLEK